MKLSKNTITMEKINCKLTPNALQVLEQRYLLKDDKGKVIETPEQMFRRVADNIADTQELANKVYKLMCETKFLPNSPAFNAGTAIKNYSACFSLTIHDSMEDIFEKLKTCALIFKSGGGVGLNVSELRPKGASVKSTTGVASGVLSFASVYNSAIEQIKAGGKRRGASILLLDISHPEVIDFIHAKDEGSTLSNFNLSVLISDKFINAVKNNDVWNLEFDGKIYKTLPAQELFAMITKHAWQVGDPGVIFESNLNKFNCHKHVGLIHNVNPCGEISIFTGICPNDYHELDIKAGDEISESCNLGSFDVSKYVENGNMNWDALAMDIPPVVRFLDCIPDRNEYTIPMIEKGTKLLRKIGLGLMGFADMIALLGFSYNSQEALDFAENLMEFINFHSTKASVELAKVKGMFPAFKGSAWDTGEVWTFKNTTDRFDWNMVKEDIKKHGIRNCNVNALAPTGTLSILAGCSSSLEPIIGVIFEKHISIGILYETNPIFKSLMQKHGLWTSEIEKKCSKQASIQHIPEIPYDIKRLFLTSYDVPHQQHIKMQMAFQKFTDINISKCVAKGTLIQTNKGLIPIEECGKAKGNDVFDLPLDNLMVIDCDGKQKRVISHYSNGLQKTIKIVLKSGAYIEGTYNHKVLTNNGWKTLNTLTTSDYVACRSNKFDVFENEKLPELEPYYQCSNHINFPKNMNPDFAMWLGMITADGSCVESTGNVSLTEKDNFVSEKFDLLSESIFGIKPKIIIDKRNGVVTHVITSRHLVRLLHGMIGTNAKNKKVPKELFTSSTECIIGYLSGLTLDGYSVKSMRDINLYYGVSKSIAEGSSLLGRSIGMKIDFRTKTEKDGYTTYGVSIIDFNGVKLKQVRSDNIYTYESKQYLVPIPQEAISISKIYDSGYYNTYRRWKRYGPKICHNTTLENMNISYDKNLYFSKVKNIEIKEAETFDIEVEDSHSYVTNSIISHNTINMRNDVTVGDVTEAYFLASHGCKGITIYRDGSKTEQVLVTGSLKEAPTPRLRFRDHLAVVREIHTACGVFYNTITVDEYGIFEDFQNNSKKGGCDASNKALGRATSMLLRHNVPVPTIIKQFHRVDCNACIIKKARSQNDIDNGIIVSPDEMVSILSCADGVSQHLNDYYGEKEILGKMVALQGIIHKKFNDSGKTQDSLSADAKTSIETIVKQKTCPECGSLNIIGDRCETCRDCGFSKCL